jgi:hypothetical protein
MSAIGCKLSFGLEAPTGSLLAITSQSENAKITQAATLSSSRFGFVKLTAPFDGYKKEWGSNGDEAVVQLPRIWSNLGNVKCKRNVDEAPSHGRYLPDWG